MYHLPVGREWMLSLTYLCMCTFPLLSDDLKFFNQINVPAVMILVMFDNVPLTVWREVVCNLSWKAIK